jgi:multidrug transporter EmrE-like cation transporter
MEDRLRQDLNAPTQIAVQEPKSFHFSRRQSITLVFFCTVFGAAAQILFKFGANAMGSGNPLAMVHSLPLVAGCSLYGISAGLLVLALKDGELSILYPVISLTYIWVTFLSMAFFKEAMNLYRLLGVLIIVAGVVLLGRGGRQP